MENSTQSKYKYPRINMKKGLQDCKFDWKEKYWSSYSNHIILYVYPDGVYVAAVNYETNTQLVNTF